MDIKKPEGDSLMKFSIEETITRTMFDSKGNEIRTNDTVVYKNREDKDVVGRVVGFENGLVILKNILDDEQYKVRANKLGKVLKADVAIGN